MFESNHIATRNSSADGRSVKMPVVLQVLPQLHSGGVERGTVEIASALARGGWGSLVASEGGSLTKKLAYAKSTHFTLPLATKNPFGILMNIARIGKVIRKNKVNLVHARSRAPAWSAYFAAKRANIPFVTTFHGIYGMQTPLKKRYNSIMTRGDRVIAISEFTANHIVQNYQINPDKIRIVHRGVDLEIFDPERVSQNRVIDLARKWQIPLDMPIIMLPARITRWKGQHILLDALKMIENHEFHCILVGDDESHPKYRDELQQQIIRLGLAGKVKIVGNTEDMPAAYMLANIVVNASIEPESFGRVAIEAQAMGKLTIASGHGGAKETIIPGQTGWLVEPSSAKALAEAIDETLSLDDFARDEITYAAMDHVRGNFSTEVMCEKELAVYRELV